MANQGNHPDHGSQGGSIFRSDEHSVPVEAGEPVAPDHPRRSASAEFIVEQETGSVGVLREAMDPANQSLAEALRLSYRVLQIVIVILLILFLVSGFKRIENSQTGVQTLFGSIQGKEEGTAELQPGLAMSIWPYPAAEFIVFNQVYALDLTDAFWPNALLKPHATYDDGAKTIQPHDPITPGVGPDRDGMVLLDDGLGHVQLQATYRVDDPVDFVENVHGARHGEQVVRLAVQRAMIHVASRMTLDELIDQADAIAERVQNIAQSTLDDLDVGIEVGRIQMINQRPPVAIYSSMTALGQARSEADTTAATARSERNKTLAAAAGAAADDLLAVIEQYETALIEQGPESSEARSLLRQIDELIESDRMGGAVADTIARAEAYREGIQSTLASYAARFESLYPQYCANPDFIVRREIYDAYSRIMGGEMVEVIMAPGDLGAMNIQGATSSEVMLIRRRASQERRKMEAMEATGLTGERLRHDEHNIKSRLGIDEEGNVVGRGALNN